jgi:UPF0755 protein
MRKLLPKFSSLLAIVFVVIGILGISIVRTMEKTNGLENPLIIELKRGSTVRTLANQLKQHQLLEYPEFLIIWARVNGYATRLQAGEFMIQPGETLTDLLNDIVSGHVRQYALTLVEGWSFKQFMQAINDHEAIEHTLQSMDNEQIMSALGFEGEHPEGRFFPDTYFIHKNITDVEALLRAYNVMAETLQREWDKRDEGLPFKNSYEALILASIVEKETAAADERPIIAGVFVNRLRKNMRLQTDPTVIYGIGDKYDGDIRFRDLRKDTPYNTYTRRGLTPTPIAMPGIEAIKAVLHPAKTDNLYFVAIHDGSGRHKFSSTLEEHEKAVDKFQRKR